MPGIELILKRDGRRNRTYSPQTIAERLKSIGDSENVYDAIRRTFRFPREATAARRGQETLTRHQCKFLFSEIAAYLKRIDDAHEDLKDKADLLFNFPGVTPDYLDSIGPEGRLLLRAELRKLQARKKLDSIQLLSAALAQSTPKDFLLGLVNEAYPDDSELRDKAEWVSAVARAK